ncbi:MAG: hypothetical protein LUB59_07910 [Candidatus Gastranaerophilales bacterium]|nr:hypothetical protein [Candidatus Gastranaerophilales bacterium]
MKKTVVLLLLISIIHLYQAVSFSGENAESSCSAGDNRLALYNKSEPIIDEFVQSENFPQIYPVYVKDKAPITDELIENYKQSGAAIKLWVRKKGEYKKIIIDDELVNSKFKDKFGSTTILKKKPAIIEDDFAKNSIDLKNLTIIKAKNCYDFTKAQIPVQLKIIKNLTTKNNIFEGDSILFKTAEDMVVNGIHLPKGTKIVGRVETISDSDKMGTPANIVIDNFYVKNNPDICFYGAISKTGANRALWVYPLYQAGNLVLYVAGFVFVPIHGGHAKLLTNETYTVFYEVR